MADDREEGGVDATPESAKADQPAQRRGSFASRTEKALTDFAMNLLRDRLGEDPIEGMLPEAQRQLEGLVMRPSRRIRNVFSSRERPRPTTRDDINMANSIERYKNPERSVDDDIKTRLGYGRQPGVYTLAGDISIPSEQRRFAEDQRTSNRARAYNELLRAARETLARPMPSPTLDRDSPDAAEVRRGMGGTDTYRFEDLDAKRHKYSKDHNLYRFSSVNDAQDRGPFTLEDDLARGVGGSQIVLAAARDAIRRGDYPRAKILLTEGYDMPIEQSDGSPTVLRLRIADGSRGSDDRQLADALLRQVNNYLEQEAKKPRSSDMGGEADPDDQE